MNPSTKSPKPNPLTIQRMSALIESLTADEQRTLSQLLQKWDGREERRHSRFRCSLMTEYFASGRSHQEMMTDISIGGAFIEASNPPAIDQDILQVFHFPNFEIPIRSRSRIVWVSNDGFGVKFDIHKKLQD